MNPAVQAEFDKGARVFPVLRVDWASKGLELATSYTAPGGVILPGLPMRGKAVFGGWGPVQYGPGVRGSTLATTRTTVRVEDVDQQLARLLETYNPRGSMARVSWAALGLVEADWEPLFVGVVEDWLAADGGSMDVVLKTDEFELRSPAPKPSFARFSWPAADPALFGTSIPLVLGIHDSFRITVRGQVRSTLLRPDDSSGTAQQLYSGSLGNLKDVYRLYYDGVFVEPPFTVLRGLYGGIYQTVISIARDDAPGDGVLLSFDASGPDATGGITGPELINPAAQLRVYLEEYVFRANNDGVYVGPHPLINQPSWAAVEAFFDSKDAESAVVLGSLGSRPAGLNVVESFLDAYQFVRMWWNESGQIEARVIDYTDTDPDPGLWVEADKIAEPGTFRFRPGDRKDVANRIEMPYLLSDVEGEFLATHEAHDVPNIETPLAKPQENRWTQARYDRTPP